MLGFTLQKSHSAPLHILALGAHADDIEIGCGGTILALLSEYSKVTLTWVVFSASDDRRSEAEQSAARFGEKAIHLNVVVKNHRDGYFPWTGDAVKDDFEALKSQVSPDLIFTHVRHDAHQDHRLLCELTWNTWRDHLVLEYEIPKYDGDLGRPNFYVPLTEETARRKASLLMDCYPSQRDKAWFREETFLSLMRLRGIEARAPEGFAEGFSASKFILSA